MGRLYFRHSGESRNPEAEFVNSVSDSFTHTIMDSGFRRSDGRLNYDAIALYPDRPVCRRLRPCVILRQFSANPKMRQESLWYKPLNARRRRPRPLRPPSLNPLR